MAVSRQQDVLRRIHQNATSGWPGFEDCAPPAGGDRGRTVHVGALLEAQARRAGAAASVTQRVAQALADTVDDEFRAHCRVAGLAAGTLTIHVDHAARIYLVRRTWVLAIRDRLLAEGGIGPVQRIIFEQGLEGAPIGRKDE